LIDSALRGSRRLLQRTFGSASPLFIARLASAALVFALPLVLVRVLSPTVFGLYKQFFLVGGTVLLAGQLGLTQSLFYFLPRGGEGRGAYFTQALASLSALGALAGVVLFAVLSWWHGTGELAAIRLPLALYTGLMLAASPLEGALISDGKVGTAAFTTVILDVLRAAMLCVGALWSPRVGPFWAAALSAALRLAAVLALSVRGVLPTARPTRASFRAQIGYALPFAGAAGLHVLLRSFPQYAISARFDAATFALFSVAAFHIPTVDIVYQPIADVLVAKLSEALAADRRAEAVAAWREAVVRLATILFPATVCAFLFGPQLIVRMFTPTYAAAIPLFFLATLEIPLSMFPPDALLRSLAATRLLFILTVIRLVTTATLVSLGLGLFGLRGAIVGNLIAETLGRALLIAASARRMAIPVARLVPAGPLLLRLLHALAAGGVAWVARRAGGLAIGIAAYGAAYLALLLIARRFLPGRVAPSIASVRFSEG
jgi:O-antigen/teichoic acid export membrane protein